MRRVALASILLASAVLSNASRADAAPKPDPKFRVRVSRNFVHGHDPLDLLATIQAVCDIVTAEYARRHEPVAGWAELMGPVVDLAHEFQEGKLDAAYLTGYEYVQASKHVRLRPIATASLRGTGVTQTARVIVRKDDPAKTIADLKGRTFVYQSHTSTVGYVYPRSLLLAAGQGDVTRFFGRTVQVTKEKSAIYAVVLGEADVASVSSETLGVLAELKPALVGKLRVIHESPPVSMGVLVLGPKADPRWVSVIHDCLCADPLAPELQELLKVIRLGHLKRAEPEQFESVQAMADIIERALKRYLCPICGSAMTTSEVHREEKVGEASIRLCSEPCVRTYAEHCRRAQPGAEDPLLVVGVSLDMIFDGNPMDALALAVKLYEAMQDEGGRDVAVEVVPSLAVARARLEAKTLSLVSVTAPGYVRLRRSTRILPLARNEMVGPEFRLVLLTTKASSHRAFTDLAGGSIALTSQPQTSARAYLAALLREQGRRLPEDYFDRIVTCPSNESAIRAVSFGQADAALVRGATYDLIQELKPGVCRKLRVLLTSDSFLNGPTCARPDLDPEIIRRLRKLMLGLHESPEGRAILGFFRARSLVAVKDADYNPLRRLMEEHD
jgi:phosphonate transport system substrate-binding protein